MTTADVVIVGGGIAGWSAAYFAARAGRVVTVIDAGVDRASDLPIALINPLRGHAGRLIAHGIEGMHASLALIDALRDAGHVVDGGRGLYRPLIDVGDDARDRAYWADRIGARLAFDWHDVAPSSLGLADAVPALYLRDAAWVAPRTLLDALRAASGAEVVSDRVTRIEVAAAGLDASTRISLASGATLDARTVSWCAGAWGAAALDRDDEATTASKLDDAAYKPGSLLAIERRVTSDPLSFGLYATPWRGTIEGMRCDGTLIGPTREGSQGRYPRGPAPDVVVGQLGDRIARVFGVSMRARPVWRGVRLARLSTTASLALQGIPTLTALGSRGFLMAPMLAAHWARSL